MKERRKGESVVERMIIIDGLTMQEQRAIYLAIRSIDVIRSICRNPGTTHEKMEEYLEEYKRRKDYMGQILTGLALHYMDTGVQEKKSALEESL